jgi:hypothetical protein
MSRHSEVPPSMTSAWPVNSAAASDTIHASAAATSSGGEHAAGGDRLGDGGAGLVPRAPGLALDVVEGLVEHRRVDPPRAQGVDRDLVGRQLERRRAHQAQHGVLGGRVRRRVARALDRGRGADDHDPTRPPPWAFMARAAAWSRWKAPTTLMSSIRRRSASVVRSSGADSDCPAQATATPTRPKAASVWRTRASAAAGSVASPGTTTARPPMASTSPRTSARASAVRAWSPTGCPARASASTRARPIPRPAPVTSAAARSLMAEPVPAPQAAVNASDPRKAATRPSRSSPE